MGMKRFMLSIPEEMEDALEYERRRRLLETIPETARVLLGEYLDRLATIGLTPIIIKDYYFEIGRIDHLIRVAGFITPHKPNILTKPILNEMPRTNRLKKLFNDLGQLKDYKVEVEPIGMLLAQGTQVDVPGIRANIARKDGSETTIKEVVTLIEKHLGS